MFKRLNLQNLIFVGLALYILVMLFSQQSILDKNIAEYRAAQRDIAAEQARSEALQAEKEQLDTDEYLERKVRGEFGYVKDDEIVFIYDYEE